MTRLVVGEKGIEKKERKGHAPWKSKSSTPHIVENHSVPCRPTFHRFCQPKLSRPLIRYQPPNSSFSATQYICVVPSKIAFFRGFSTRFHCGCRIWLSGVRKPSS